MWKPFWRKMQKLPIYEKIKAAYPDINFESAVIAELTGGDRALVSSLEGFEDLQLIGQLQYQNNGIQKGDTIFAVTEGGETSSVIGTILHAARQYGDNLTDEQIQEARKHLYYVYNNNNDVLECYERCRAVLDHTLITKISLCTG